MRLRRYSLDKVGRINPPLECSVWFHELPMCVRGPMRMPLVSHTIDPIDRPNS
jgi:hypothetical protein